MRKFILGISIDIQKKDIKRMHLQIKPPDGNVVLSAPLSVDDRAIELFVKIHINVIQRAIRKFQDQARASKRQYISGETCYILGTPYKLIFKINNHKNSFEIKNNSVILSMHESSTVKQRENYVKEEYRKILKQEITQKLPKWEKITGLHCDSWQIRFMNTKWGTCNISTKKLWFNLQLAQKSPRCIDYIILHELTHLITSKHDQTFISHMDQYMPKWRNIRDELNAYRLDYYEPNNKTPLQRLFNQTRYKMLYSEVVSYLNLNVEHSDITTLNDFELLNVININQPIDGIISLDVIARYSVNEQSMISTNGYLKINCHILIGVEITDFKIIKIEAIKSVENLTNIETNFYPIISNDLFEAEAENFLLDWCPSVLEQPIKIPIEQIFDKMKLTITEESSLSNCSRYYGSTVFENSNVYDHEHNLTIRNAKRKRIYLDPSIKIKFSNQDLRAIKARACFHWYRYYPYHILMKMIGADDQVGESILSSYLLENMNSVDCNNADRLDWQSKEIASRILIPAKTARLKVDEYLNKYSKEIYGEHIPYDKIINELALFFDVTRQMIIVRLFVLGYQWARDFPKVSKIKSMAEI